MAIISKLAKFLFPALTTFVKIYIFIRTTRRDETLHTAALKFCSNFTLGCAVLVRLTYLPNFNKVATCSNKKTRSIQVFSSRVVLTCAEGEAEVPMKKRIDKLTSASRRVFREVFFRRVFSL